MIGIVDYGAGNLNSVYKALKHINADVKVVSSPEELDDCTGIILPGVGNFADGMNNLKKNNLDSAIINFINTGKPFLGICLGMQLLLEESEEAPGCQGLGIFKGKVVKFPAGIEKVPHMGWNTISIKKENDNLNSVNNGTFFYFVHSYYVAPEDEDIIIAETDYIKDFPSIIGKGNVFATQFHPEKSQDFGLKILENFLTKCK
jgi:glutamine amidotransferase